MGEIHRFNAQIHGLINNPNRYPRSSAPPSAKVVVATVTYYLLALVLFDLVLLPGVPCCALLETLLFECSIRQRGLDVTVGSVGYPEWVTICLADEGFEFARAVPLEILNPRAQRTFVQGVREWLGCQIQGRSCSHYNGAEFGAQSLTQEKEK